MTLSPEEHQRFIADLERRGVNQVRSELERGTLSPAAVHPASAWLAEKDKEDERRKEASNAEQMELARRASDAAERAAEAAERSAVAAEREATAVEKANKRATLALVIAIVSIIATGIGIWTNHRDAQHDKATATHP